MENMREEFEDWYRDYEGDDEFNYFARCPYEQEQYDLIRVHDAWNAWQASRAAMCVELPEHCEGMALTVREFHQQLDKAGVTYK